MVQGLLLVLFLTALLTVLFGTPVVAPFDGSILTAYQWLYSAVSYADRFIAMDTMMQAIIWVMTVRALFFSAKFYLWAVGKLAGK